MGLVLNFVGRIHLVVRSGQSVSALEGRLRRYLGSGVVNSTGKHWIKEENHSYNSVGKLYLDLIERTHGWILSRFGWVNTDLYHSVDLSQTNG